MSQVINHESGRRYGGIPVAGARSAGLDLIAPAPLTDLRRISDIRMLTAPLKSQRPVEQYDRGDEHVAGELRGAGARIERVNED